MISVRCRKEFGGCGLRIIGRFKSGPPKVCPHCGVDTASKMMAAVKAAVKEKIK